MAWPDNFFLWGATRISGTALTTPKKQLFEIKFFFWGGESQVCSFLSKVGAIHFFFFRMGSGEGRLRPGEGWGGGASP